MLREHEMIGTEIGWFELDLSLYHRYQIFCVVTARISKYQANYYSSSNILSIDWDQELPF